MKIFKGIFIKTNMNELEEHFLQLCEEGKLDKLKELYIGVCKRLFR